MNLTQPTVFNPPPGETLFSVLVAATRRFGRNTPGQWEDQKPDTYSYGDLLKMTLGLGRLACKISEPGEHVGVLMPNVAPTVSLLIGLSAFGRVPCMLNYTAGSEGMQSACQTARVRTVLTSRLFLLKADLLAQAEAICGVRMVYLEDLRKQFSLLDKAWLMGFALWFPLHAVPKGNAEAPAAVLFTSGSEGNPKAAVLSHRALLANVSQTMQVFPFSPAHKIFNALPIFHSLGLTAGTLIALVSGARLVLYTSPLHFKVVPEMVREKKCTVMFGTSTFLHHYARYAGPDDFKSVEILVAGAEKLADSVRETWRQRFGVEILEGYGVTEMAPVLAVNLPQANRPGSVGRLLPGVEARVLPVPGIDVGGELHVRGPNLMSGYYRHEAPGVLEPPCSAVGPGWHNTGDVASIDDDGYVLIQGRLKRFAKVAGEMISLEVVEIIAQAASTEAIHAATWISDPARGELIVLCTTDTGLQREQLAAVARRLGHPEIAVPKRIHVVESLPMLGTGKIDYMRLKSLVSAL